MERSSILARVVAFLAVALISFPVAWMVSVSLRLNREVFAFPPQWLPDTLTTEGYRYVLENGPMMKYIANSYIVAFSVSLLSLFLAVPAAYAFSRYGFIGRKAGELFVVSTQMVPPIVLVIPYFVFLVQFGMQNTLTGLVITYVSFALPFSILMLTRYLNGVPRDLDEAARVDGATPIRTIRSVLLPVIAPGIMATALYSFMLSWNEFLFAITMITSNSKWTFPIGVAFQVGDVTTRWNIMMSYAVIGSLPIVVGFFVLQKQLIAGLTAGAGK